MPEVQWIDELCPHCGLNLSMVTATRKKDCLNTNCDKRKAYHGIGTASCPSCKEKLARNVDGMFCPNPECERYMRQQ